MEGGPIVVNLEGDEEEEAVQLDLPPGFRFHPTDEEIITHYLTHKLVNPAFTATALGDVDLNKCEPWDLPKKAKMGEKEWYFFCQRDRKYPTGMRTNRATEAGYWKATGKDKEIYRKAAAKRQSGGEQQQQVLVGMKKTLVFYRGRAPKGEKSNWVMHEFRLDGQLCYHNFPDKSVAKDEWVVCKVFHKNAAMINKKDSVTDLTRMNSFVEGIYGTSYLPSLLDPPCNSNANNNGIEEDLKGTIFPPPPLSIASDTGKFTNQMENHSYMTLNPSTTTHQSSHQTTTNYYNYDQTTQNSMLFYPQNANVPYQASSSLGNYLHQQMQPCKVEQYSSNLSRSQDTGLSTDLTAEISSRQEVERSNPNYNAAVEGASAGHLEDFDSFWNFQA